MARLPTFLSFFFVAPALNGVIVNALVMSLEGVRSETWTPAAYSVLSGRSGIVDLQNSGDLEYYMNVTLGGREYRVLVDGGSADLWVAGAVPGSNSTSHSATIKYNDGAVAGQIQTATLQIEGVTIANQAYIEQSVDSAHPDGAGILGLGPSDLSSILGALGDPEGNPPLDRLLAQDTSADNNYVTMLLGRSSDNSTTVPAQLTIGEILPTLTNATTMPQLSVDKADWDEHWMIFLDNEGIVGPDGKTIEASQETQFKVIFDSGYTLSQVPKAVADAIYSRVPGAKYATISSSPTPVWVMPCSVELNITFKFGGVSYPIHPLDTVTDDVMGPLDDAGRPSCVGSFQPMATNNPYDLLLGMTFLRNAYILINLGNSSNTTQISDPSIQLLSITDPEQAHHEFVQQRLGGIDTTGSFQLLPAPSSNTTATPSKLSKFLPWIIAASVLGGIVLICGVVVTILYYSHRRYRRLHAPAPIGVLDSEKSPEPEASISKDWDSTKSPLLSPIPAHEGLPNSYEQHNKALKRKQDAGDLMPNRKPTPPVLLASPPPESAAASSGPAVGSEASQHQTIPDCGPFIDLEEKPLLNPHDGDAASPAAEANLTAARLELDHRWLLPIGLPSPYGSAGGSDVDNASPESADTQTIVNAFPLLPPVQPLHVQKRASSRSARPLPNPHEYGYVAGPPGGQAATFDMSRTSQQSTLYALPALEISSSSLGMSYIGSVFGSAPAPSQTNSKQP